MLLPLAQALGEIKHPTPLGRWNKTKVRFTTLLPGVGRTTLTWLIARWCYVLWWRFNFCNFYFWKRIDPPLPLHHLKCVPKGIPNKSVCNALLKSFAFHIQASCSPDTAVGHRIRLLWFITEVFKIRQSNYRLDSPQCLQSAKFKKCKILTGSDKYIMKELLKCKLPAFWYSCGAWHRSPEPASL